ncbi:hypothetical protein [Scytonema sp. PCC 10023]|uniref:hypothetical protein n=1 Tax=Scytonema sp. PCC 10023 TaxID=1680591 RepID=UPI0039C6A34D
MSNIELPIFAFCWKVHQLGKVSTLRLQFHQTLNNRLLQVVFCAKQPIDSNLGVGWKFFIQHTIVTQGFAEIFQLFYWRLS